MLDRANRYAFAVDLGVDKILVYRFDATSGKLKPNQTPSVSLKPGAGPRHFVFHPSGRQAYVINELDSTITVFTYYARRGTLTAMQTVSTLPKDFSGANSCADIHLSPSGKFLYGSNRGHDSLAIFAIERGTGKLQPLGHELTQGKTPRNFAIDPTGAYLLAANQNSDSIVTFRIDKLTGKLTPTGHQIEVPAPVCLKLIPTFS
jgi:6-phosphogluconolactonase